MTEQYGPSGGGGGDHYLDILPDNYIDRGLYRISEIVVRSGDKIDAVTVTFEGYGNPQTKRVGGGGGDDNPSITLQQGEYIIAVYGRSGDVVDAIAFQTNFANYPLRGGHGEIVYYGGNGGRPFVYTISTSQLSADLPNEEIIGFFSHYGDKVDSIGVYARQRPI